MTELRGRHAAIALTGALVLHLAVLAAWLWDPPPAGTPSTGAGGVSVSLGPAGGAAGTANPVMPRIVESRPVAQSASPRPVPAAEAVRPQQTTVAAQPVIAEPADPPRSTPVEPQPPEAVAAAEPVVRPARAVAPSQPPASAPEAEAVEVAPSRAPPVEDVADAAEVALAQEPAGAGGRSGTQDRPDVGSGDRTEGGGSPGDKADYMALLRAWLEKHKEYPRRARLRRQEGTAMLYFVLDREGKVLDYQLRQSSGHRLLDREVVSMIQRAQPLPEMPEGMRLAQLELILPVQFRLH